MHDQLTFLGQLSDAELVKWSALLESGDTEASAQLKLCLGSEPYISILSPERWEGEPLWRQVSIHLDEVPSIPPIDGRLPCGVRVHRGVGLAAPIVGAVVVVSACEGLGEFHELAAWMAYRRGCRRFHVIAVETKTLNDDELASFTVMDAASSIADWFNDVVVSSDASTTLENNSQIAIRTWSKVRSWHDHPDHWVARQTPSLPTSRALLQMLSVLETLAVPVCGLTTKVHHRGPGLNSPEHIDLDFRQPGHGLPFQQYWKLDSPTGMGRCMLGWIDESCWTLSRSNPSLPVTGKLPTPGFMLPSLEYLRNAQRMSDLRLLKNTIQQWRTIVGPDDDEVYWALAEMLGLTHRHGYSQLGGSIVTPTIDLAVRCRDAWMPLAFSGGDWGRYSLYLWICPVCPNEVFLNFQS